MCLIYKWVLLMVCEFFQGMGLIDGGGMGLIIGWFLWVDGSNVWVVLMMSGLF